MKSNFNNQKWRTSVQSKLINSIIKLTSGKSIDLLLSGNLTGQKQPKQRFQKRLAITGSSLKSRQNLLTFRNSQTTESNSLIGIQIRCLPHHTFDRTGSSDALIDGNFADDMRTVFLFELQQRLLFSGNLCFECFCQSGDTSPSLFCSLFCTENKFATWWIVILRKLPPHPNLVS